MKVAVIGAGYVGLITALGLARLGRQCVCVEKNPARLSALRRGEVFFHEPGVPELLAEVRRTDRFSVTDDLDAALVGAEVAMIAVGTPSNEAGIDLTDVRAVAAEVGAALPAPIVMSWSRSRARSFPAARTERCARRSSAHRHCGLANSGWR